MTEPEKDQPFEGFAILELMGHRRLGGYVRQVEMFGSAMCRIDVPEVDGQSAATQFYSSGAIYAMTPCSEATARAVAAGNRPAPIHRWELPSPKPVVTRDAEPDYDGDNDDIDDCDDDPDDIPFATRGA